VEVVNLAKKVVSLEQFKIERQYKEFHTTTLNLALDTIHKPIQRNIRKEMISGYMKLLSNIQ
jgi:putative cell wall-binding protein